MGPRPFSRGNGTSVGKEEAEDEASMGPRPFSRGNDLPSLFVRYHQTSFNGATAFQPWKFAKALIAE